MRKTAELTPYANNSRTHSTKQIDQIVASINEWGWTMPVLVDEKGMLIAGHGRIMAAQKLGIEEVPTMVAEGWTEAKKKAYIIADNKLALNAGWDDEMLKLEFEELQENGFDLELTGFDENEINVLYNGWQTGINPKEKDGHNLDGIKNTLKLEVSQSENEFAKETITNALDSAGIDYEWK